jgi:polyphosphate:AMP phosphotransferase
MFEAAKLGRKINKATFKELEPQLRAELLEAQRQLADSDIPVFVIISGMEGAGKGEVVNRLNKWLDARGMETNAYWDETDEERERPRYWRFWRTMPPRGSISIMFGAWYMQLLNDRVRDRIDDSELDQRLSRIVALERMLTEDRALILKFWFHLNEDTQRARLLELSRDDRSRWKMTPKKSDMPKMYRKFESVGEHIIRNTDSGFAQWYMIEANDRRYRDMTVGRTLLHAMRAYLDNPPEETKVKQSHAPSLPVTASATITILDHVDLDQSINREEYKRELEKLQNRLNRLVWEGYKQKRSCVLVFEGSDAGGKGGAIRRVTNAIDARLYRAIPIAAPTDEERAHHYLWRFWRHIPRAGRLTIYDRSWYGRVLVERVEGFATESEWHRAYQEINDFEEQLVENGTTVLKFWLHISKEEQLKRFKEREQVPYKQHKITDEDWRNREKWDDYAKAVNEMVIRTSTEYAPWKIIAGNDKLFARIEVLKNLCEHLEAGLKGSDSGK